MKPTPIRAVAFDMGGTLEEIYYDDDIRLEATLGLQGLLKARGLDPGLPAAELQAAVINGMAAYQSWREDSEVELPPERVWGEYVFADGRCPGALAPGWAGRLVVAAEELAQFYESRFQVRSLRAEAAGTLKALHERGMRLAVISNIISRDIVQQNLAAYRIAPYFEAVVTSAGFGRRKPHASIFLEAARLLGLPPAACAYVGDTISREVIGAQRAGYGLAVQIRSFLTDKADSGAETARPDAVITDLMQIVDLLGPRVHQGPATIEEGNCR
jgi:putative hydrolase of the HAD superfamily